MENEIDDKDTNKYLIAIEYWLGIDHVKDFRSTIAMKFSIVD